VAKPEWGTKRTCLSCGARFYDLQRSPIACPTCGTVFDLESAGRSRRTRAASRAAIPADDAVVVDPELLTAETDDAEVADDDAEEDDAVVVADDTEEDEALIEDASELGEDEDDVGDVIDGVDEEEESR